MFIKDLKDCPEFISGDGAALRELLNANNGEFNFRYSLAHAIVKPTKRTKRHKLKYSEVYYIISGQGRIYINDETMNIDAESVVYIPPNAWQYIENTGNINLVFLCIVDPAWQPECESIPEVTSGNSDC